MRSSLQVCFILVFGMSGASAACPGGASWCRDAEAGAGSWTGAAPAVQAQAGAANRVLRPTPDGALYLVPEAETRAATRDAHFIEARLRPARLATEGASKGYLIAAYADDANWLGFGLELRPGSNRLEVVLARMEDGKLRLSKRVGQELRPAGSWIALRLDRNGNALTLYVNGQRTIGSDEPPLPPARIGVRAEGGDFEFDDMRIGPLSVAPASMGLAHQGLRLSLQAGGGAQRYPVRLASRDGLFSKSFSASSSNPAIATVAVDGDTLVLTPRGPGQASVTLTSQEDNNVGVTIAAEVAPPFVSSNQLYALDGRTEPGVQAQDVPPDSVLRLRFDSAPQLGAAGSVRIYRARDDVLVDELHPGQQVNAIGAAPDGVQRVVRWQPLKLEGSQLLVRPHGARLEYDTEYYVTVDAQLLDGARLDGKPFGGLGKAAGWRFRTRAHAPSGRSVRVDDDGPADFRTVQGALDHVMRTMPRQQPATIVVANGSYDELLYLRGKDNLTIRGESRDGVHIAAENNDGLNPGSGGGQAALAPGATGGRSVFLIEDADLLHLDSLTITNTTWNGRAIGGQAEALLFSSEGRLAVTGSSLISEQDTVQVKGYAWFYRSLVAGTVDFIWGVNHAALFEECEIRSLGSSGQGRGGYVVQARTAGADDPGFVFLNNRFTHGPGPAGNDVLPGSIHLARPGVATLWDKVVYVNSRMDSHIAPSGWNGQPRGGSGWFEFNSTGLQGQPLDLSARRGGRLIDAEQAAPYSSRAAVFARYGNGQGWNPSPSNIAK
ncbi:pectinesterase family protein [Oxalobacteraceae bacterium A2-2]